MNRTPLVTLLLAATLATGLTGCGAHADPSVRAADTARTTACRTYLLDLGGQDAEATRLMQRGMRSGGWTMAPINQALAATRDAAKEAGTTADLSAADFKVFAAVVDAYGVAHAAVNPGDGGPGITDKTLTTFRGATDAAREMCEESR